MKAAVYHGAGKPLVIENVADPTPGAGQVVIKTARCGICASDLHMTEGHMFAFEEGAVPGHEVAGEVVALGAGVSELKKGDRVAVLPYISCGRCKPCLAGHPAGCEKNAMMGSGALKGGYAEYVLADERWCVRLPATLGFDDGALVEPLAVSLRANLLSGIKTGDRVLVMGAGPIGLAAAYWARQSGAGRIAVSATSTRRESMAMAMGIDHFITPEEGRTLGEQAAEKLGAAPDIVFECAGVPGSLDGAVEAVKPQGTIACPGFCWDPDYFTGGLAMVKETTIKYSFVYTLNEFEVAVGALDRGHVEPRAMITDVVNLDQTPDMFESLKQRNNQCKVQIAPWLDNSH